MALVRGSGQLREHLLDSEDPKIRGTTEQVWDEASTAGGWDGRGPTGPTRRWCASTHTHTHARTPGVSSHQQQPADLPLEPPWRSPLLLLQGWRRTEVGLFHCRTLQRILKSHFNTVTFNVYERTCTSPQMMRVQPSPSTIIPLPPFSACSNLVVFTSPFSFFLFKCWKRDRQCCLRTVQTKRTRTRTKAVFYFRENGSAGLLSKSLTQT